MLVVQLHAVLQSTCVPVLVARHVAILPFTCSRSRVGRKKKAGERGFLKPALDKDGKMKEMLPEMLVGIMLEMVTGAPTTPKGGLAELLAAYEAAQARQRWQAGRQARGLAVLLERGKGSSLISRSLGYLFAPKNR